MFRDLLSSRWFQGGFAFFVLVVGSSLLYHWHVIRTTESDMARHDRFTQGLEKPSETRPTDKVNDPTQNETSGLLNTPDETTDTPMPDTTETLPNETDDLDFVDAFLPDEMVSEEEVSSEEVPVSPFGFGPYPKIPDDFPSDMIPIWTQSEEEIEQVKNRVGSDALLTNELLHRVLIQLWVQGDKGFTAGHIDAQTHRVFAMYPNTGYVTYSEKKLPNGEVIPYINTVISSDPMPDLTFEMRASGDIPGVKIVSRKNVEIDPYTFLSLNE